MKRQHPVYLRRLIERHLVVDDPYLESVKKANNSELYSELLQVLFIRLIVPLVVELQEAPFI